MREEVFTNIKYNGMAWTIRSEYLTPIMNEFVKKLDSFTTLKGKDVIIAGYDVSTLPLTPPSALPLSPLVKGGDKGGGGVRILRSTIRRTTLSVPSAGVSDSAPFVNEQRVVVKRYHIRRKLKKGIKYLFRQACAKTEWDMMNALLDRGISTCIPLAYGEKRRWGFLLDESLIVREIPDCLTLQAYIKRHYSGTLSKDKILRKRELLRKLANFISHIHEKNIEHRDFHRGNILVTEGDSGEPVFYLIDLHKARVCRRLSLQRRVDNFATILTTRRRRFSKTDCLRLIKHYVEHSNLPTTLKEKKGFKSFASKIFKRVASEQVKRFKKTAKLCLRTGDTFASFIGKDVRIYYRKDYDPENILNLVNKLKYDEGRKDHRVLKRSSKTLTFLEKLLVGGMEKQVVIEYNRCLNFLDTLKKTILGTESRRAWIAGNCFIAMGIPIPQPIALVETKRFIFTKDVFLITEYLDNLPNIQVLKTYYGRDFLNHKNDFWKITRLT